MKTNVKKFNLPAAACLVLLIGTIGIQAQNRGKRNSDEPTLPNLVRQMTEAQSKFDPATLERIYASDFIEISPIGEVDAREKTIGFYKPEVNPDRDKLKATVTSDEFLIRTYDNFAVVIARITYTQTGSESPAARPPFSLRVTLVCRKEKDSWKISSAQYTGIRPPRPQPVK